MTKRLNRQEVANRLRAVGASLKFGTPAAQLLLCQERFLVRLASLEEGKSFIWKGGSLILRLYRTLPTPRYTVDIDLLLKGQPMASVRTTLERAMAVDLSDGFQFTRIASTPMLRETPYGGDRYEIDWRFFGKGQSHTLKIDVCAGDLVKERLVSSRDVFLVATDGPDLTLSVYPPEFIFAEKLETAVRFGGGNTRFKDFIDMWALIRLDMNPVVVKAAIGDCFGQRKTNYTLADVKALLADASFAAFLEETRQRSFRELELPPVSQMFADLSSFLDGLDLPR